MIDLKSERYELYRQLPSMFHSINAQGVLEYVSDIWLETLKYEREDVIGRPSTAFLSPKSRQYAEEVVLPQFFKTGRCTNIEYQFLDRLGHPVDLLLSATATIDAKGQFVRSNAMMQVVTDRNEERSELQRQTALLEAVFQAIPDAVIVANSDREILRLNQAVQSVFGYTEAELIGQTTENMYASRAAYLQSGEQHFNSGTNTAPGRFTRQYKRKNGTLFPGEAASRPIHAPDGTTVGYLGIVRDTTERVRLQQQERALRMQLEATNQELLASNVLLEHFSTMAAHDLQEPLYKIRAFCDILAEDYAETLDDEAKRYLTYVVESGERMQALIQSLLIYAQTGVMDSHHTPSPAQDAVHEAISALSVSEDVTITVGDLPNVRTSTIQLARIFQNLIGNSIKYRLADRPVDIHVSAQEEHDGWVFSVQDNGIGIEPRFQEQIFKPFKRLHAQSQYTGSGIGLSLVQRMIESVGGTIWVDSQVGVGSVFRFSLPSACIANIPALAGK